MNELNILDPNNYIFNIYFIPVAIAAIFVFVFGISVFIKERASFVGWLFLVYVSSLFFWFFGITFVYLSSTQEVAIYWSIFSNTSVVFIPPTFFLFSVFILNQYSKQKLFVIFSWAIPIVMLVLADISKEYIVGLHKYYWGYYIAYGKVSLIFLALFTVVLAKTLYMYWRTYRTAPDGSALKKRSGLLFIGFSVGTIAAVDFLPGYGVEMYPIGFVFIMLLIAFSTYVVWHHKFVDITPEIASSMILEAMNESLVVLDTDNIVRVTNNSACQLLGINKDDLLNKNIKAAIPQIDFFRLNALLMSEKEISGHRIDVELVNGVTRNLEISARMLFDKARNPIGYLYVMHDVTVQYQAEQLLQRGKEELENLVEERTENLAHALELAQQASVAKSEFVSTVSHELRTPLTSIVGSLGLVLSGKLGEVSDRGKELLSVAERNANRLSRLINDILDIQKIESGRMEFHFANLELNGLLQQALESTLPFAVENQVSIKTSLLDQDVFLEVDPDRLTQVISNLLSNAIKFSPMESVVELKLEETSDKICIHVSDRGPGIPLEYRDKIFEKFTQVDSSDTRRHSGTGLGLNISQAIVEKLGGKIYVKENNGGGSVFSVELTKGKTGETGSE